MGLAVLPAIVMAILTGASASKGVRTEHADRLERASHDLAAGIEHDLTVDIAGLGALARSRAEGPAFDAQRQMVEDTLGGRVTLRVGDEDVQGAANFGATGEEDIAHAVQRALNTGQPVVSDVIAPAAGIPGLVAIVVPVVRRGMTQATLDIQLPSATIGAALRRSALPDDDLALLVDGNHRIAAASRDEARLVGQMFREPPRIEPSIWSTPDVPLPSTAELAGAPGWRVVSVTSRDGLLRSLSKSPIGMSALAGVVSILVSLGLVLTLGEQLTQRLRALSELARNVAVGNENQIEPSSPSGVVEFEAVRQALLRADAVLRRRGAAERMALREARTGHELLVSVLNGTTESIYVKDLELRYVLVNRAALLSGPEPRAEWQVLGRGTTDLFAPVLARRIELADRTVLATGQPTRIEQDHFDLQTGEQRWLSMTITPWQDVEGRVVGVVSVGRDITESRKSDARLLTLQADLLRTTRLSAMGAMGSGLAHELNQPLAAATNFLNASNRLLDRAVAGHPDALAAAREAVADGAQQLLRAGRIVRRLRDFVERGEVELQEQSLAELLREACELARNDASMAGIELRLGACGGSVMADRTQIQQVLLNLIRNAGEAISGAAQDRRGEIVVDTAANPDGGIFIEVSDNGPGLTPDIAARLFEPFVSSKTTGMGIGLAICQTIVEGHGGLLTAEPAQTGGVMFRIALPALHLHGELA